MTTPNPKTRDGNGEYGPVTQSGVPAREWTDDEWLAVMRTVPPDADASVGEAAVAEKRGVSHAGLSEHMRDANGVCVRCHRCSDAGCCVQTIHCAGLR